MFVRDKVSVHIFFFLHHHKAKVRERYRVVKRKRERESERFLICITFIAFFYFNHKTPAITFSHILIILTPSIYIFTSVATVSFHEFKIAHWTTCKVKMFHYFCFTYLYAYVYLYNIHILHIFNFVSQTLFSVLFQHFMCAPIPILGNSPFFHRYKALCPYVENSKIHSIVW